MCNRLRIKNQKLFDIPGFRIRLPFIFCIGCRTSPFIYVATKESASIVSVLLPWAHTYPTKFMRAMFACHVIATIIFLNKDFTFRARFGISSYPSFCREILCIPPSGSGNSAIVVIHTNIFGNQLLPIFHHFATSRIMWRTDFTLETKSMLAQTSCSIKKYIPIQPKKTIVVLKTLRILLRFPNGKLTCWAWAPLNTII